MRLDREVVFSGCEWIFCVNSPMPWRLLEEMWYKPVLLRVCALVCVGGDTHQHTHTAAPLLQANTWKDILLQL